MAVRKLHSLTPTHDELLEPGEKVLSNNKVTGWSLNVPIVRTCQPTKVCIMTCYFSNGGSSWSASLNKQVRVFNSIKKDPVNTAHKIVGECVKNNATFLRWNGGGDLFDESIVCLTEVAKLLPAMPIWVVTRIPDMASKVPNLKNIFVHFSLDKHSIHRRKLLLDKSPLNENLFFSYQCDKGEEPPVGITKLVSVVFWDGYKMKAIPELWDKTSLEAICQLNWRKYNNQNIEQTCETCRKCFNGDATNFRKNNNT